MCAGNVDSGDTTPFVGRVIVVAGHDPLLAELARALTDAGALVARLAPVRDDSLALSYRGDPADVDAWGRVAPQVEQRLGPVDLVACDLATCTVVRPIFGPDISRRGHGGFVDVSAVLGLDRALSLLAELL